MPCSPEMLHGQNTQWNREDKKTISWSHDTLCKQRQLFLIRGHVTLEELNSSIYHLHLILPHKINMNRAWWYWIMCTIFHSWISLKLCVVLHVHKFISFLNQPSWFCDCLYIIRSSHPLSIMWHVKSIWVKCMLHLQDWSKLMARYE